MQKTTDETGYIYEKAKGLMDEREKDYQGSWREEGLGCAVSSAYKKGSQIRTMFENGRFRENIPRTQEDCLDAINYYVFCYRFLDLMKEEKG